MTSASILRAAADLVGRVGYANASIERIAAEASVGKQTIYRWWPNKGALAMESFLRVAQQQSPFPETCSPRADLRAHLHFFARSLRGRAGRLLTGILAEAQKDPATREAFIRSYVAPRRQAARALLERGIARGEFRPGLDVEGVCDALYGFFYMRLLLAHAPMDDAAVDRIVDLVLNGISLEQHVVA